MPFYDFRCARCDTVFNVQATMEEKERKLIPCPGCGGRELKRVYQKSNISLISRSAAAEAQSQSCRCCENAGCPHKSKA